MTQFEQADQDHSLFIKYAHNPTFDQITVTKHTGEVILQRFKEWISDGGYGPFAVSGDNFCISGKEIASMFLKKTSEVMHDIKDQSNITMI